jgi:hypothetical protein
MQSWFRHLFVVAGLGTVLLLAAGCAEREHRKVRVTEEQHESEVVEEQPGEMVVE